MTENSVCSTFYGRTETRHRAKLSCAWLESLNEHSGGSLAHDDVTFVVVEALDE